MDDSHPHGSWRGLPETLRFSEKEWNDWRWQMRSRITKAAALKNFLRLTTAQVEAMTEVEKRFRTVITPYYLSLANPDNPNDPILRQSLPDPRELEMADFGQADPLAEEEDMPVPGLTHRYEDRALMVVTNACAMFCRHCTRKRIWNSDDVAVNEANIAAMIEYVRRTPQIRDVIVSGGDPFTLPTARLESILKRLRAIPHVEVIRIGTRTPVTVPMRIDEELCAMLDTYGPIWVNTQFNHPQEITEEAAKAVDRLIRHGICVNNQSVLMRGINDDPEIIKVLCRQLVRIKVRPYYLFQCDQVEGVEHFRTRISRGIEIMENLRGHTTGFSIPTFVVDGPEGTGKIPVMPNYLISQSEQMSVLRNYEGMIVGYRESGERVLPMIHRTSTGVAGILAGRASSIVPAGSRRMTRRAHRAACSGR
ncbi:MAG: Lysine 2,3-aminomutase [Candidatus Ozemobacter sibiricus]|uniref:L-lysine 2,3-aminomutase n=1 Tax=Candidatus Ozemobacter sibiricus TaxID=2268124 RepID=A0A367ZSD9_9BACT|nr:MAG: Lysine 2,3-aminomutase [Candidatus Ozemobacter sibiricus]